MVNPIQITQPQAYSGGADFSPLAKLYDVYKAAQERAREEAAYGRLGDDPIANQQILTQSGAPRTAQLGLGMQDKEILRRREDITAAQAQRNWQATYGLNAAQGTRAQSELDIRLRKEAEDTPEARAQKMDDLGIPKDDPNYTEYKLTGQNPPSLVQRQQAAKAQYELAQSQKYDTREKRLAAATEGGLDKTNPTIMQWIALGPNEPPDIAKGRLGIGTPVYTQDKNTGEVKIHQLRNDIPFVPPENEVVLGPGQIARQKAEGAALGKGTGAGQVALPDVIRTTDTMINDIDSIINHTSKSNALGVYSKTPDWSLMIADPHALDFRERVGQLSGEAMQNNMSLLKGSGLGSVSDFEQRSMMNAFIRAGQAKSEKDFDTAMKDARRSAEKIREVARNKAKGDFTEKGVRPPLTEAAPGAKPSLDSLIPLK